MTQYLVRRLLLMVPVAFLVSVAVFALIHLTPGDPAQIILGEEATPESVAALRRDLGLDRPLYEQYTIWIGRAARGDLGRSVRTSQPVLQAIGERLPATFELGLAALLWSLLVAIPLGTLAALRRGSALDWFATGFTVAGVSVPNFFIGILLILFFALVLRALPPGGYAPLLDSPLENLRRLVLPAITLGTVGAAINMRFTRSSMIEVLRQDYIRTARAKGASWLRVVNGHALKNALIPVVTVVGIQIGAIIEGALVTETVFSWPGVGKLAVDSIFGRDYTIIQGIVLIAALSYMLANLLVDLTYAWLDPRIAYD
ncbi:MAG TPA: ABC transporter permease [Candidatus Acidoferrales bacterium]|nr:ABC transporter permease [Candidatus Acidoferrales bacterium]